VPEVPKRYFWLKALAIPLTIWYNTHMKDLETQGDLRDEYIAIQEAELLSEKAEELPMDDEEVKLLLRELWDEMTPVEEEEYTEIDAWRDFWQDREDAFN